MIEANERTGDCVCVFVCIGYIREWIKFLLQFYVSLLAYNFYCFSSVLLCFIFGAKLLSLFIPASSPRPCVYIAYPFVVDSLLSAVFLPRLVSLAHHIENCCYLLLPLLPYIPYDYFIGLLSAFSPASKLFLFARIFAMHILIAQLYTYKPHTYEMGGIHFSTDKFRVCERYIINVCAHVKHIRTHTHIYVCATCLLIDDGTQSKEYKIA